MAGILINSLDDPRLAVYRDLKDRELARQGQFFIAESELVVRRLLASRLAVESLLVTQQRADEMLAATPQPTPIYIITRQMMRSIVGFPLQSGILACGRRQPAPSLQQVMEQAAPPLTLMILPEAASTENLGAMVRIAAAFGCHAVILGERSCDPFYRQSIRISMGAVFSMPIVRCQRLVDDLQQLRQRWNVRLAGAVLDEKATPLQNYQRPARLALLLGNEAHGLRSEESAQCDDLITIPMAAAVDSLNVAVSAGIMMYALTHRAG